MLRCIPSEQRDTLSVIFAALGHDPTVHRFTEKLEQRKGFRLQCCSHADRLRLAGRGRGAALTLRAPGDRPAAPAVGRLQFNPESGSRPGRFEVPGQVCIWGNDELEALLILDTKTADQLEISMMRNVLTCRVQNPDTQRAGRVGTAQGGRRGGATLGRTRFRHFGRLGSQQPLWPPSAL